MFFTCFRRPEDDIAEGTEQSLGSDCKSPWSTEEGLRGSSVRTRSGGPKDYSKRGEKTVTRLGTGKGSTAQKGKQSSWEAQ